MTRIIADGTHHAGIIWRAGPLTGPRPRCPYALIMLLCVTSPRAPLPTSARASSAVTERGFEQIFVALGRSSRRVRVRDVELRAPMSVGAPRADSRDAEYPKSR